MEKLQQKASLRDAHFTEHQLSVIRAWADYETAHQAAAALGLRESTLQTHLKRMRAKIGVSRTFGVYQYLTNKGLL